jgi:hypothetical protein
MLLPRPGLMTGSLKLRQVKVSGAGDKVLVVSVACRHRRDAVAKVCRALEGLRLRVITANVTSAAGTVTHTALVQVSYHQLTITDEDCFVVVILFCPVLGA